MGGIKGKEDFTVGRQSQGMHGHQPNRPLSGAQRLHLTMHVPINPFCEAADVCFRLSSTRIPGSRQKTEPRNVPDNIDNRFEKGGRRIPKKKTRRDIPAVWNFLPPRIPEKGEKKQQDFQEDFFTRDHMVVPHARGKDKRTPF